jgi:hypothetical protein
MKPIDKLKMGPDREVIPIEGGFRVTVTPPAWTGIKGGKYLDLSPPQYLRYLEWMESRVLIQDALPELRPDQREILLTGM